MRRSGELSSPPLPSPFPSQALSLYAPNATEGADNAPLAARLMSDLVFECGTRHLARKIGSGAWLYRFDERARDDESPPSWGVTHGSEVPFVFDRGDWVSEHSAFTPPEAALATTIGAMWARFAARQPPLADGWPEYTNSSEQRVVLAATVPAHSLTLDPRPLPLLPSPDPP